LAEHRVFDSARPQTSRPRALPGSSQTRAFRRLLLECFAGANATSSLECDGTSAGSSSTRSGGRASPCCPPKAFVPALLDLLLPAARGGLDPRDHDCPPCGRARDAIADETGAGNPEAVRGDARARERSPLRQPGCGADPPLTQTEWKSQPRWPFLSEQVGQRCCRQGSERRRRGRLLM
jgi:hypothetical protein